MATTDVLLARIVSRTKLRHWQLVREIANLGGLQKAADTIGLSQPAATHALLELERLLGYPLFERHAKGMRLSLAGEAVMPKVFAAMDSFAEVAGISNDVLKGSSAEIRIGAIRAALYGLVAPALVEFSRRFPLVAVQVLRQRPGQLVSNLHKGYIDLAVCREPKQLPAETVFTPVLDDHYVIACSPRHPLVGRSDLTLAELSTQLWLCPPKSTIAERDYENLWSDVPAPKHLCWVESEDPLILWTMLDERLALALTPCNVLLPWVRRGLLTVLPGPWEAPMSPLGLVHLRSTDAQRRPVDDLIDELTRYGSGQSALRRSRRSSP